MNSLLQVQVRQSIKHDIDSQNIKNRAKKSRSGRSGIKGISASNPVTPTLADAVCSEVVCVNGAIIHEQSQAGKSTLTMLPIGFSAAGRFSLKRRGMG